MKTIKKSLLILALLVSGNSLAQTNATAASPVDCNGVTHDLFAEMDAGKIIVIGWTMPCATCASPLLDVHNAVLNFAISDPGVVEYWLTDDFANTDCNSIQGWCSTNGITNATIFSSAELSMFDYGTTGMPKVVVVGCTDHKVYYNRNDSPTGAGVTDAVNQALSDIAASCQLGNDELNKSKFDLSCYPNPANSQIIVSFNMATAENVSLEVLDLNGAILKRMDVEKSKVLEGNVLVDVKDLKGGVYLLKIVSKDEAEVIKFQVIN
jgi:hypothetical protein